MRSPHPFRTFAILAVAFAPALAVAQSQQQQQQPEEPPAASDAPPPADQANQADQAADQAGDLSVRGEVTGIAIGEDGSAAVLVRTSDRTADPPRAHVVVARPQEVESLLVGQMVTLDVRNDRGTLRLAAPPEVS